MGVVIPSKVFIQHAEKPRFEGIKRLIEKSLHRRTYNRVIIKPNLCLARKIPAATTDPLLMRYVTRYFVRCSKEVIAVESDGLINTADEAFDILGIRKAVEEEGGKVLNMSNYYPEKYIDHIFPHDLLVNLPILKTHEFTIASGAVKNMFGMIPDKKRVKHHPKIAKVLVGMCKKYNKQLIIMDGIRGMEGHGPTKGKIVNMKVLIGGTNPAAIDRVMCKLMGFSLREVPHIEYACRILNPDGVKIECEGVELEKLIKSFEKPKLDPITKVKMWVWRHEMPNDIMFVSPLYKITRSFGIPLRKAIRHALKMRNIDK